MASPEIPHRHHALIGAALAFIAAIAFSAKAILVKIAYAYPVDAVTLLTLRMVFSVPFFLAIGVWQANGSRRDNLNARDWLAVIMLGLTGYYVGSLLDFWGLYYIPASLERLILFLYPTLVLLSAWWLRRRVRAREVYALVVCYAGIALLLVKGTALHGAHLTLGAALVFGSALTYAIYLIGSDTLIARIGSVRFTAYSMTVSSIAIVLHFLFTHELANLRQPSAVYILAISMALLSTVLPAFLLAEALRRIGAKMTSIIGSVGPVATLILGALVLGETITAVQLSGTAIVIAGVLWISLHRTA